MELKINNNVIDYPIYDILLNIRSKINNNKLSKIIDKGQNVMITCPFHSGGHERHPSCQVFADPNGSIEYGITHCFACGKTCSLYETVNACFDQEGDFGKNWLCDNYGSVLSNSYKYLETINLNKNKKKNYIDESILDKFNFYHPYMEKRHLSLPVIRKFKIGFDKSTNSITFPVWDQNNNLVMITKRNVDSKIFHIDKDCEKPVYLLNFILNDNIKTVYVTESQINCLTLHSWGYPAIGLMGTGTKYQYDILSKCGIRHYILALDGDPAGDKGTLRFIKNMPNDVIIDVVNIPRSKDVNDLTKDDFDNLKIMDKNDWLKYFKNTYKNM